MSSSRRSHGRIVIASGIASALILGILAVTSWDSLYTGLFLDSRLVGTWQLDLHRSRFDSACPPAVINFRSNGVCEFEAWGSSIARRATYRISDGVVSLELSEDQDLKRHPIPDSYSYGFDGRRGLTLRWKSSRGTAYYMRGRRR